MPFTFDQEESVKKRRKLEQELYAISIGNFGFPKAYKPDQSAREYIQEKYDEFSKLYNEKKDSPDYHSHIFEYLRLDDEPYTRADALEIKEELIDYIIEAIDFGGVACLRVSHTKVSEQELAETYKRFVVFNAKDNDFFRGLEKFLKDIKQLSVDDPSEYVEQLVKKQIELENLRLLVSRVSGEVQDEPFGYELEPDEILHYKGVCTSSVLEVIPAHGNPPL